MNRRKEKREGGEGAVGGVLVSTLGGAFRGGLTPPCKAPAAPARRRRWLGWKTGRMVIGVWGSRMGGGTRSSQGRGAG